MFQITSSQHSSGVLRNTCLQKTLLPLFTCLSITESTDQLALFLRICIPGDLNIQVTCSVTWFHFGGGNSLQAKGGWSVYWGSAGSPFGFQGSQSCGQGLPFLGSGCLNCLISSTLFIVSGMGKWFSRNKQRTVVLLGIFHSWKGQWTSLQQTHGLWLSMTEKMHTYFAHKIILLSH